MISPAASRKNLEAASNDEAVRLEFRLQSAKCAPAVLSRKKSKWFVSPLLSWFAQNARDLPWRRTRDPYAIWVSEIMLQQTQVKTVVPFWNRWMRELPTLQALADASSGRIHKLWEGLGYYSRVRNLQKAAQIICHQSNARFPSDFEQILSLPGIGRYTAGAIASIAFNQPKPILDGNVIRVLTRVFGIGGDPREKKTNSKLWALAAELVELASRFHPRHEAACSHFNQSLMELGALICTPPRPDCGACPLQKTCFAFQKRRVPQFPRPTPRPAQTRRRFAAFVLKKRGRFLVQQRTGNVVNAQLWEFPNLEIVNPARTVNEIADELFQGRGISIEPFCTIEHSITRYRITLEAYSVSAAKIPPPTGLWKSLGEMKNLPFTAAHRKILSSLIANSSRKQGVSTQPVGNR